MTIRIYSRGVHPDLLKRGHPDINNRYIFKGVQSIKGIIFHPDLLKEGVHHDNKIYCQGGFTLNNRYLFKGGSPFYLLKRGHPDINNRYIFKGVQSIKGLYFTLIYLKRGFTMTIRIYSRGVHPDLLKRGHPDINNRYLFKGVQSIKGNIRGHPD